MVGLSYLEGRGDWVLVGVGDRTRSGLEQTELCWLGYRPGIGIVHENANSVAVKLTFCGGKKLGYKMKRKNEAPVLAALRIPMKQSERVDTWLCLS